MRWIVLWVVVIARVVLIAAEADLPSFRQQMALDFFNAEKFLSSSDWKEIDYFDEMHSKNRKAAQDDPVDQVRIPKVFHFIWVGSKPFPKESFAYVASWVRLHPDWKFKFWTDRDYRKAPHEQMEKHLISEINSPFLEQFLSKTECYAEQADLIRYAILDLEGGVYVDHDVACFAPVDSLNQAFHFFAFLEPPHFIPGYQYAVFPTNSCFGSSANHPILRTVMQEIGKVWNVLEKKYPGKGGTFVRVLNRTFIPFSLSIKQHLEDKLFHNVVLPAGLLHVSKTISVEERSKLAAQGLLLADHQFANIWRK